MAFETLPPPLAAALTARGYEALTPVQAAVITPEAEARDLIVSAETGSGKTVAFGLAMAAELLGADGRPPRAAAPLALVIAPTRELALQVGRELEWLYAGTGARIATAVGGMDSGRERRALAAGAHILIGTPGRLCDHLERGALQLGSLKVAILDEADEMLDMGFRDALEQLLDATPAERRTLMFSATLPKTIQALARRYQKNALPLSMRGGERGHGDISYQAVAVAPGDIENAVVNVLRFHEAPTAMLFCATRDNVRRLHASLVERGFDAVALSGEHSQSERNAALQALRDRRARLCVATDVAARGIDLPQLSLVIHVELPRDAETLQHRSGRTGRAGKKGTAVLIVPYPARRRVEAMLRSARIEASWTPVPTPADIRAGDRTRLLEVLRAAPAEIDEEDRALATALLAERTAEDIAAQLVASMRAKLPAPEELHDPGERARAPARRGNDQPPPRATAGEGGGARNGGAGGGGAGGGEGVWFRMDVGRRERADPRWLLPLLCRRGHVSRAEVGTIRIGPSETLVEIHPESAARFADAVLRTEGADRSPEGAVRIVPVAPLVRAARPALAGRPERPAAPVRTLSAAKPLPGATPPRRKPRAG